MWADATLLVLHHPLALVVNLGRNVMAAAVPLFGHQAYDRMGIHGAGSLVAGLATALALVPFVISAYGSTLRKRSPFAQHSSTLEH